MRHYFTMQGVTKHEMADRPPPPHSGAKPQMVCKEYLGAEISYSLFLTQMGPGYRMDSQEALSISLIDFDLLVWTKIYYIPLTAIILLFGIARCRLSLERIEHRLYMPTLQSFKCVFIFYILLYSPMV